MLDFDLAKLLEPQKTMSRTNPHVFAEQGVAML